MMPQNADEYVANCKMRKVSFLGTLHLAKWFPIGIMHFGKCAVFFFRYIAICVISLFQHNINYKMRDIFSRYKEKKSLMHFFH